MDPALFLADLEEKPRHLRLLADAIDDGWPKWPKWPKWPNWPNWPDAAAPSGPASRPRRVLMVGMGSSLYAAQVAAQRCRVAGITAIAESGAVDATIALGRDDVLVAISAGGESPETVRLVTPIVEPFRIAVTNSIQSTITAASHHVVDLLAGIEHGGVACRSFAHTLVGMLSFEDHFGPVRLDLADRVRRAAEATAHLLDTRGDWLDEATNLLAGPHGTWLLAPAERSSSAMQGALMLREGPRRAAVGCETGDWSHVDVYLTKTMDYRALVFTGSQWDQQAAQWLSERRSMVVAVGGPFPGAPMTIRHPGDDDTIVRLLTETTVPELIAASLW